MGRRQFGIKSATPICATIRNIFSQKPKQQSGVAMYPPLVKPFGPISSSSGNYKPQLRYTTKEEP
jgi:hypothetical protein